MLITRPSIVCCALSLALWLHHESFGASLTGVSTASAGHFSNEQDVIRASPAMSGKALSLASSEASSYVYQPAPIVAPRARTSWLPPLLFQRPTSTTPSYPVSTPASAITLPARPLVRRSQSTTTSVTSSFYSRSAASSETTLPRQPCAIGATSYRSEDLTAYGSPSSRNGAIRKPEVPPIPEKWRTANRGLPPSVRPCRPSTRPGLPPPAFWQHNAQYDDSRSWMTENTTSTDREGRDPPSYRHPIIASSLHSKYFADDVDEMLDRQIGPSRSYGGFGGGGSKQLASRGPANAQWLDLDDRADRRKERERRTLVKKRQPRDL